jgi:DNA-binding CsgD family transcriptional regulator/PAS domain-containing protein
MTPELALSDQIGRIYDTVVKPEFWPDVLAGIAGNLGARWGNLFARDSFSKTGMRMYEHGTPVGLSEAYFSKYIKFDPTHAYQYFIDVGVPVTMHDMMPEAEFKQTRFYKEFVVPYGNDGFLGVILDKSMANAAMMSFYSKGYDDITGEDTKEKFRLYIPHLIRAVSIGRLLEQKTIEASAFSGALDCLRAAMFLVDATGRIVHTNSAAEQMLETGDPFCSRDGKLCTLDSQANDYFRQVFAKADGGDTGLGTMGISVMMKDRHQTPFTANALPLKNGIRTRSRDTYNAVSAVFAQKAALDTVSPPELVAKTYKLTPSELRVMLAVVELGGVPEAAAALGSGESTVKSHLASLFAKTGSRKQADLVKIFAGFASPVLNQIPGDQK